MLKTLTRRDGPLAEMLPWVAFALLVLLAVAGAYLQWINRTTPDLPPSFGARWAHPVGAVIAGSVGLLLVLKMPRNVIGWAFVAIGLIGGLNSALDGYAGYALHTRPGLAGGIVAAWIYNWMWVPLMGVTAVYFPLLFPDGSLLRPAWRKVLVAGGFATALATVLVALRPGPLDPYATIENPLSLAGAPAYLADLAILPVAIASIVAVAGQFVRYRRAADDQRHQIKWVAAAAAMIMLLFMAVTAVEMRQAGANFAQPLATALVLAVSLLPVATAVAVLRYRLYDIDLIINRTFVYVPLTAMLAGLYVSMSGLLRAVLTDLTDAGSEAAIAMSTLTIVALLTPAKNRLQAIVDRRFKEPPDPHKTLRDLMDQARSFAGIAERGTLLVRYLEAITAAFDASGAEIDLVPADSSGHPPLLRGSVVGDPALHADLAVEDAHFGTVNLYARSDGRPYTTTEEATLHSSAAAVSRVIALTRLRE